MEICSVDLYQTVISLSSSFYLHHEQRFMFRWELLLCFKNQPPLLLLKVKHVSFLFPSVVYITPCVFLSLSLSLCVCVCLLHLMDTITDSRSRNHFSPLETGPDLTLHSLKWDVSSMPHSINLSVTVAHSSVNVAAPAQDLYAWIRTRISGPSWFSC